MSPGRSIGFTFPEGVVVRRIRPTADGPLCVECEGRLAMMEIQKPDETSARLLCGQCIVAAFAPRELTEDESTDWEVRAFEDAERTATPAAPVPGRQATDGEVRAARLALMVMRGKLCARPAVVSAEGCVIRPGREVVSYETAAALVARMPKPLECRARVDGEVMTVLCREITEPGQLAAFRARHWKQPSFGPDVPMVCVGFEETLLLTIGDWDQFAREYDLRPSGWNAGSPSGYLSRFPREVRAAVAAGAQLMMSCSIREGAPDAEQEGRAIVVRGGPSIDVETVYALTADLDGVCEVCRSRAARWVATDVRSEPWQDRRLCDACVVGEIRAPSLADVTRLLEGTRRLSEKGRRATVDERAATIAWFARWWKVLPMPAEIVAVFDQLRAEGV